MAKKTVDAIMMGEAYREFKVLRTLAKARTALVKAELQRRAKMNYSTTTDTLNRLEEKGLVKAHRFGATQRKFTMIRLNEEHPAIQGLVKFFEESE